MHDRSYTANLLGAAALAVTDHVLTSATKAAGVGASGAAALVVLSSSPGLSVTELGRRVGLSQPAAVRMVDSLEADGLVERHPSAGRAVLVQPTSRGEHAASRLLAARSARLTDTIAVLDDDDHELLAELLIKLLTRLYDDVGSSELLCRLCDRATCTSDATCPVGQAERDLGR